MENREQQILSEIKALMSSVRLQLEQLDVKMAELQQVYDPQSVEVEEIDLGFDMPEMAFVAAGEVVEAAAEAVKDDLPFYDTPQTCEVEDIPEASEVEGPEFSEVEVPEEVEIEAEAEDISEVEVPESPAAEVEDIPEIEEEEDLPLFAVEEEAPATLLETAIAASPKSAVIDVMTAKQAWRTDMPGSPVKDIRAAIALVDRALFINKLFGEDAAAFMETINAVNQMTTLDEAVEYLASAHPTWNFESDIVYRFMMAIRRKVN
jgi:hypothetical protein